MSIRINWADTRTTTLNYEDGRTVELVAPFYCSVSVHGVENRIVAPVGFVSDWASVPRPLWSWIPPTGKYSTAALLHDWLYYYHLFPRGVTDEIFLTQMRFLGVGYPRAALMWKGVKIGGHRAYHRHDHEPHNLELAAAV